MKTVETFFKNIFLRILLIFSGFAKTKKAETSLKSSKILFIRLNRIGDALVSTPILHLVKKKINCKVYLLADKKNFFVYKNNPDIDVLVVFKKGFKGVKEIVNLIKKEKIDTIVDLHDDVSTTVSFIIALSSAPNKFGLEKENKIIFTKTVPRLDPASTHVVNRILEIGRLFNLNIKNSKNKIGYYPVYESLTKAENFIKKSFSNKSFLAGINISAGSEARFWGVERFKLLVQFLLNFNSTPSDNDINLIILSAKKDIHYAEEIINSTCIKESSGKIALFCSENFDEFGAIISNLNILFTPDTAAVHLAAAFNVPVFGIYVHDTNDIIWSPYGVDFDCVATNEPNLKNMDFAEVKNKFKPFLENKLSSFIQK